MTGLTLMSAVEPLANDRTPEQQGDPDTSVGISRIVHALTGLAAAGYYLSAVLHLAAYTLAVLLAWWLGVQFSADEPEVTTPLAASLADEDVVDDAAKLEIVADLSVGQTQSESSAQQLASHLRATNAGWLDTLPNDALQSFMSLNQSDEQAGSGSGLLFKMPESGLAVTRGSFTAWTEPANPEPGQNYLIIIQIRLPDDVTRYRLSDLSGKVVGSDTYTQNIPYEESAPLAAGVSTRDGLKPVRRTDTVDVIDNKVQLAIKVPGASRLVRDTITIRSRRLRENQQLTLTFGTPAAATQ